jgi:hypothetical protein
MLDYSGSVFYVPKSELFRILLLLLLLIIIIILIIFSLALQPSAAYGLLVHEVS